MANTHLALIASLTISILLSVSSGDDLEKTITEICQQTFDSNFCTSVLHQSLSDRKPITISDLNELTQLQSLVNVTNTLAFVTKSIPGEKDPKVVEVLKVCRDAYTTVEYDLRKSIKAFVGKDYSGMEGFARHAQLVQSSCYENFNGAKFNQNPVHEMSRQVMILVTMDVLAGSYLVS